VTHTDDNSKTTSRHAESIAASDPCWELTWEQLANAPRRVLEEVVRQLSGLQLAPVNTALVSPEGFDPLKGVAAPAARLRSTQNGSQIVDANRVLASLGAVPILDRSGLKALRAYSHVQVAAHCSPGPVHLASTLAQLLVAGVPVVVDHLPLAAQRLLGDRLTAALNEVDEARLSDSRYRETWSVGVRRVALRQFTSAGGVGAPTAATVIADLVPGSAGVRLLDQIASQDWPTVEILLTSTARPVDIPRAILDRGCRVEVVAAESLSEARRLAVARADGLVATFMSAALLYGPHHLTDLVLGQGYARTAVVGASVRRSYLPALNLCVEAAGHAGERRESRLTAGTLMSSPVELGSVEPAISGSTGVSLTSGYAIHDLGVARWTSGELSDINEALSGSVSQSSGWAAAIQEPAPSDVKSVPSWAKQDLDPSYASYFTRSLRPWA
jgi:hypothetical protein